MHTYSIAEDDGEFWFVCSCGTTGNKYGSHQAASSTGAAHKQCADSEPDHDKTNRAQTPHLGY